MKNTDTIKKNYEFKYILNKGKCFPETCFYIYVLPNKVEKNKIGIAVGKKVGNAVCRNKIKRWIREAYTRLEKELNGTYNLVFVWKKSWNIKNANYGLVYNSMLCAFKKAKIIK